MTPALSLLQEFYRDKLTLYLRHQAAARSVSQYDANNTYQYILNREEVQLSWVDAAIRALGSTPPDVPAVDRAAADRAAAHRLVEEDAAEAKSFVDRWRPRVDAVVNARDRLMLRVVLGETLEHRRFFEQAVAGRTDLLGRRGEQVGPRVGEVLPTRWLE